MVISEYVDVSVSISEDITVGINLDDVFMEMTSQQKEMFLNWILDDLGLEVKEATKIER